MKKSLAVLMFTSAIALAACKAEDPVADKREPKGREETRSIRATESIGYSGDAIADKVDATLDANDERKNKLDQAAEQ